MRKYIHSAKAVSKVLLFFSSAVTFQASSQQLLSLSPLPGMPNIPEYLVQGNGQGFAGFATVYNGHPVILYDIVWVQRLGGYHSPAFKFLRAHEFSHHIRQHGLAQITSPPHALPYLTFSQELDADCAAVQYLNSIGDFKAVQAGIDVYRAILPPHGIDGRPGAVARINNMSQC